MKYLIRVSAIARQDIADALARTLADFGPAQRNSYADLVRDALAALSNDPFHPQSRARDDLRPSLRLLHIGRRGRRARHLLVYRVTPGAVIQVGRFLHDAMDVQPHLSEGFDTESPVPPSE